MNDPIIDLFRSEMLPNLIEILQPEDVILFDSRVHGTAYDESDFDVTVTSPC